MSKRDGATLIEVLVAIMVMGIGLLALLTLFPLGVYRMAEAIQAERSAQCSRIATAVGSFQYVRNDPWVLYADPSTPAITDPFSDPKWAPILGLPSLLTADPDGPSFPVFVDPLGYVQTTGLPSQTWLTLTGNTIRRRSVSFVQTSNVSATRWFSLLDDIIFTADGVPQYLVPTNLTTTPPTPGVFQPRDTHYSWAYMLKRPRTSDRSVVELTVAVFKNRAISQTPGALGLNEYLYQTNGATNEVTMDPVENTIKIDVTASGNVVPSVRTGDWLLDASYVPSPTNTAYATVNGYFYRVVGVDENSPTSFTYTVQQPLRNFPATGSPTTWQKIVFLEGVVSVYEKGPGKLP